MRAERVRIAIRENVVQTGEELPLLLHPTHSSELDQFSSTVHRPQFRGSPPGTHGSPLVKEVHQCREQNTLGLQQATALSLSEFSPCWLWLRQLWHRSLIQACTSRPQIRLSECSSSIKKPGRSGAVIARGQLGRTNSPRGRTLRPSTLMARAANSFRLKRPVSICQQFNRMSWRQERKSPSLEMRLQRKQKSMRRSSPCRSTLRNVRNSVT